MCTCLQSLLNVCDRSAAPVSGKYYSRAYCCCHGCTHVLHVAVCTDQGWRRGLAAARTLAQTRARRAQSTVRRCHFVKYAILSKATKRGSATDEAYSGRTGFQREHCLTGRRGILNSLKPEILKPSALGHPATSSPVSILHKQGLQQGTAMVHFLLALSCCTQLLRY